LNDDNLREAAVWEALRSSQLGATEIIRLAIERLYSLESVDTSQTQRIGSLMCGEHYLIRLPAQSSRHDKA
jgi:hypothetical protein